MRAPAENDDRLQEAIALAEAQTAAELVVVGRPRSGSSLDAAGTLVEGSREERRTFSEYWTFVRAAGFAPDEEPTQDLERCPACAAPLAIGQAGDCDHCEATVTTGRFGWVLAAIDQDETCRG